ncbi:type 1 fimbrial protein [Salmonella enterica]|jgi:major type 1 subunit fimbrin (pilin)|nr:type 1 fimbrial protein [Salmonella enterica]
MEFKMKFNRLLLSALISSAMVISVSANAADGTITFNGNVTASACTSIVGAGPTGGTMTQPATVTLPNVASETLNGSAGTLTGHTAFSIELNGCEATVQLNNVRALFTTTTAAAGDSYIMGNTAVSGAGDVGIAILTPAGVQIDLNGGANADPGETLPATSGNVTLNYLAAYKSLSTSVTAGPVTGVADYVISYF